MTYSRKIIDGRGDNVVYTLTLRKEILFADGQYQHDKYEDLERLQQENFNRVKIPKFTIKWDGNALIYESEFINGDFVTSIQDYNILYEDIVLRDSDYSFIGSNRKNFIKDYRGDIYAVDLDEYGLYPYDVRKKKWDTALKFYGCILEHYRGANQLQVKIYGEGQCQTKLKQVIETMFSADIEKLPGDFACVIDGTHLSTLQEALDYLRDLYSEIRIQMKLDAGRSDHHHYGAGKESPLFDRNNRTLRYR